MPVNIEKKHRHAHTTSREKELDIETVELLLGIRTAATGERDEVAAITAHLGGRLHEHIVLTLLRRRVPDAHVALALVNGIVRHKQRLEALLGREVDVQVAALDYVRPAAPIFDDPASSEHEKAAHLARATFPDVALAHDKGALLADLQKEVARVKRYGQMFSVLFIDIDELRAVNAAHGRNAGDVVLSRITALLPALLRATDTVYRFGDDEYVVLLPSADIDVARGVGDKLLNRIRATDITCDDTRFHITASIGIAAFDDQTVQNAGGILENVTTLLSEAKRAGKNRIAAACYESHQEALFVVPPPPEAVGEHERFVIHGTPISQGTALGRAYIYEDILNEIAFHEIEEEEIDREMERLHSAIGHVRRDIERMEKQVRLNLGREYAGIFAVHRTILGDMSLINEMESRLKSERRNAEHIVRNVFKHFESRFVASENVAIRERSLDIADLGRRLLRYLAGINRNIFSRLPRHSIVVAKRLLPSESVHLRRENVAGIITEKGSRNAHAAILARGLGIPYVSETDYPIEKIRPNAPLIVNADSGEIIVNPTADDREAVRFSNEKQKQENQTLIQRFRHLALKKENRPVKVMANVGTSHSMEEAVEFGCDGIGLYRIEQIYMQSRIFPTQEQLYRMLGELFAQVKGKPIVARLLDIGGDKTLPYFAMNDDVYSVLGVRGVRLLLRYPRILETQLTALLKLSSEFDISILIPMVTMPDEIIAVRTVLEKCKRGLARYGVSFNPAIRLGAMIEVPAAVLNIRGILAHADFLSIGTNDLIQYTMAAARENAVLTDYYERGTEIVLQYIGHTLEQAHRHHVDCSLCGEIAADTDYTERLLNMGLEIFSVSPAAILAVKDKLAQLLAAVPAQ